MTGIQVDMTAQVLARPVLRNIFSGEEPEVKGANGVVAQRRGERYMLEEQPTRRRYNFKNLSFELWFPWTYYLLRIDDYRKTGWYPYFAGIFWSPEQLQTSHSDLFAPGLPNVGRTGGAPCFNNKRQVDNAEAEKLAQQYGSLWEAVAADRHEAWWAGEGNFDDFPWSGLFMIELMKRAGMPIVADGTVDIEKATQVFETWQGLDRGEVLDMPMTKSGFIINKLFPKQTGSRTIGLT